MPTDTLTAKANVGAGTDGLAGVTTAQGFAGAVMLVNSTGTDIDEATPLSVQVKNTSFPVKNQEVATTGAVTANAQRVTATVSTGNAVAIQLDGTHAGINLTFELSNDGAAWDLATAVRSGTASPLTATGVLTSNGTTVWHVYCGAAQFVSVRSTAFTSGSLNVRFRAISIGSPTVVVVQPSGTQPVSGTVAVSGTVTTGGVAAHSAAASGNPLQVGGVVATAVSTAEVAGDTCRLAMTTGGALVQKPYAVPEVDWTYAAASGGITNTTDVAIKAAAGASIRNYLTAISITNASAVVATEVVVKDGATVIWRGFVGAQTLLNSVVSVTFQTPLRGTANTALNVACITTGAAVYVNAQGYAAP